MTIYNGTTSNDTFGTTVVAGDTVDGKAGDDTITLIDLTSQTGTVAYDAVAAATATGTTPIAGLLIKNVEHFTTLKTGAGDDTLTISAAQGPFSWYGNGGNDRLIMNYASDTAGVTISQSGTDYTIGSGVGYSHLYGVELLTVTTGYGNDTFQDIHNGDVIDGGGGDDTISLTLTGSTAYSYNAKSATTSTGVTFADGTSIKHIEHLDSLTTGSGNDTLIIYAAEGKFIWQAGAAPTFWWPTIPASRRTWTPISTAIITTPRPSGPRPMISNVSPSPAVPATIP